MEAPTMFDKPEVYDLRVGGLNTLIYSDQYSSIVFEKLKTIDTNQGVPLIGVFTCKPIKKQIEGQPEEKYNFRFQGAVSNRYNFIGNKKVIDKIVESISESDTPLIGEFSYMNSRHTSFYSELLIGNKNNTPSSGDVYPHITIRNSYTAKAGIEITFGLSILKDSDRFSFSFRQLLTKIRQIHSIYAKTKLSYTIGDYVNQFDQNIMSFIQTNMATKISEDALLGTIELVSELGKRRQTAVEAYIAKLKEVNKELTAWDLFLAITKFSTAEKNLNAKVIMENIVEKVLVLPTQMLTFLENVGK